VYMDPPDNIAQQIESHIIRISAGIAGYNKWKSKISLFDKYIYQDLPDLLDLDVSITGVELVTDDEAVYSSLSKLPPTSQATIQSVIDKMSDSKVTTSQKQSTELLNCIKKTLDSFDAKLALDEDEVSFVNEILGSRIRTSYGNACEERAIDTYESMVGFPVHCRNDYMLVWPVYDDNHQPSPVFSSNTGFMRFRTERDWNKLMEQEAVFLRRCGLYDVLKHIFDLPVSMKYSVERVSALDKGLLSKPISYRHQRRRLPANCVEGGGVVDGEVLHTILGMVEKLAGVGEFSSASETLICECAVHNAPKRPRVGGESDNWIEVIVCEIDTTAEWNSEAVISDLRAVCEGHRLYWSEFRGQVTVTRVDSVTSSPNNPNRSVSCSSCHAGKIQFLSTSPVMSPPSSSLFSLNPVFPRFYIVGFVDGISEQLDMSFDDAQTWSRHSVVVEAKSRVGRIAPQPPLYDQIQMVVYMHMTGCATGDLVEYVSETSDDNEQIQSGTDRFRISRINLHGPPYYHSQHWNTHIMPSLFKFCKAVETIRRNDYMRCNYFIADDEEKLNIINILLDS